MRGRPRSTTVTENKKIIQAAETHPEESSRQLNPRLERANINISERSVRRRLNEDRMTKGKPCTKPLLKPDHIAARLEFATKYNNRNWDDIIWSDETTFWHYRYTIKAY